MWERLETVLAMAGALLVTVALYWVIVLSPPDAVLKYSQKIFYLHVPLALSAYISIVVAVYYGFLALMREDWRLDRLSAAAMETAWVYLTGVLLTGMIWAKYAWGAWWTWEPRLVATLILWLFFGGYFAVRSAVDSVDLRARISGVLVVVAFLWIFVVHFSVRLLRGIHPNVIQGFQVNITDPRMRAAFLWALAAFTVVGLLVLVVRMRVALLEVRGEKA